MSAARLAAEAAFAPRAAPPAAANPALVIVRRGRLPPRPGETAAQPAGGDPAVKMPRVFRVGAAREAAEAAALAPQAAAAPSDDPPAQVGTTSLTAAAPRRPQRRQRRVGADRRPGPVLHLVVGGSTGTDAAPPAGASAAAPPVDLAPCVERLAEVGRVLQAVERARRTQFFAEGFEAAWQGLSQQLDELARRLQAHAARRGARFGVLPPDEFEAIQRRRGAGPDRRAAAAGTPVKARAGR